MTCEKGVEEVKKKGGGLGEGDPKEEGNSGDKDLRGLMSRISAELMVGSPKLAIFGGGERGGRIYCAESERLVMVDSLA